MLIRWRTMFGSPKREKVLAASGHDKPIGMMVSSDPDAIGGMWLLIPGQGTENGKVFQVRLDPDEIRKVWSLFCEKGAGP